MNKLSRFTFATAINALCATIGLGIAATAMGAGVPCGTPVNASCLTTCDGWTEGPSFNCCSTYGTDCCRRSCTQVTCVANDDPNQPCNTTPQVASTAGATLVDNTCTTKGTCLP